MARATRVARGARNLPRLATAAVWERERAGLVGDVLDALLRVLPVQLGLALALLQVASMRPPTPSLTELPDDAHVVTNDTPLGGAGQLGLGQECEEPLRLQQVTPPAALDHA